MKTTIKILVMGLMLTSLSVKAQGEAEAQKYLDFVMFCGTVEQLEKEFNGGEKLSQSEIDEAIQSRSSLIDVLENGNVALKRVAEQGSKADTGSLGVVLVCGVLDSIKSEIKTQGCADLASGKIIKNGPGISACEKILAKLPH